MKIIKLLYNIYVSYKTSNDFFNGCVKLASPAGV